MEPYDQWLADNSANRKALLLFGLAALVLLLLLLFNAWYVVHGTRYSEHAVTSAVTIELLRDDGSWEAAAPDRKFSAGSRVRLHVPVPAHNPAHQYTLAFTAIRAYTRVSWNGEVLAAYDESHVSRSHNFGSVPMLVEIPQKALGSSITIEEELTGRSPRPFLGDILVMPTKMSYTYYLQGEDLLFVIYHTLLMISLCAAAVLLFTRKNLMVKKGLAIALFVASFDLWSMGYHHMLGFWISVPYINSLLEYGALYFLPAPFLYYLFLSEKDGHRRKIYHILSLLFLALFAAALFLESLTLYTLDDILPLLHISILCAGPLVCWHQLRPLGKEKNLECPRAMGHPHLLRRRCPGDCPILLHLRSQPPPHPLHAGPSHLGPPHIRSLHHPFLLLPVSGTVRRSPAEKSSPPPGLPRLPHRPFEPRRHLQGRR